MNEGCFSDGYVILESPALPVREGNNLTLFCQYKKEETHNGTSDFSAHFYKNGVFFGTYPTGNITFSPVTKSDEGFYSCKHPTKGESPQSWLVVTSEGGSCLERTKVYGVTFKCIWKPTLQGSVKKMA